jgi:phage-related minor tail protein
MTQGIDLGIRLKLEGAANTEAGVKSVATSVKAIGDAGKAIPPVADNLRKVDANLQQVGISAKQTAAALRGVPAQFTDIFTSLSFGQAPMQVLIQQGGQLKDMFGGVGPAARALGGYVAGMVNPLTVGAAAVGALTYAWYKGRQEQEAYASAIIMTGNAAGTSVGRLQQLAQGIDQSFGITQGAAAEALTQLVATGRVGETSLGQVAAAAIAMEQATGQAVADTVKQFAELGKSPVDASIKLNEQYHYLTAAVFAQVKALEDQGRTEEAAKVAQEAFAAAVQQRAEKIKANLGSLERGWNAVTGAAKEAWDAMLAVGRDDPAKELKGLKDRLSFLDSSNAGKGSMVRGEDGRWVSEREHLTKLIALKEGAIAATQAQEKATADKNAKDQAGVKWLEEGAKYLDKQTRLNNELTAARTLAAKAGVSDEALKVRLSAIEEKYAEKRVKQTADTRKEYDALVQSLKGRLAVANAEAAANDKLTEGEKKYAEFLATSKHAGDAQLKTLYKKIIAQEKAEAATAAQKKAEEELAKIMADVAKGMDATIADQVKVTGHTIEETERIRDHTAELLGGKAALEERAIARLDDALAAEQAKLAALDAIDLEGKYAQSIRDTIAALKDQRSARGEAVVADATAAQRKEFEKYGDDIKRSVTDGLMRGFEAGGRDGSKIVVDNIHNALKTGAFKVVVDATVNTASNAVGQMLGIGGKSGGLDLSSLISAGGKLFSGSGSGGMSMFDPVLSAMGIGGSSALASTVASSWAAGASSMASGFSLGTASSGIGLMGSTAASGIGGLGAAGGAAASAGMMSTLAAAAPWLAAGLVIADAAGLFGKRGGPQSGQYGDISAAGYKSSYTMSGGDSLGADKLAQVAYAQATTLLQMAGKSAAGLTLGQGYKLDPQGTAAGVAYRNITLDGRTITGGTFDGNSGGQWYGANNDGSGAAAYLGKLQTGEILALVKAIGDPALEATVGKLAANFTDLNQGLTQYLTAQSAQKALAQSLMTDDERAAAQLADAHKSLADVFGQLARAVPASTADFRAYVEAIDITTQAGQDQIAQLAGVSDSFQLITEAAKEAEQQQNNWRLKLALMEGQYTEQQANRYFELAGAADDATRALMQQVYALEDQAAAATAAAAATQTAVGNLGRLAGEIGSIGAARGNVAAARYSVVSSMSGFDASAYWKQQQAALTNRLGAASGTASRLSIATDLQDAIGQSHQAQIDAITQARDTRLQALQAEQQAAQAAAQSAQAATSALNSALANLGRYASGLLTSNLTTLSPEQQLAEAGRQYQATLAAARRGDADAIGNLQGASQGYLDSARGYYASGSDYASIFAAVQSAVAGLGATRVNGGDGGYAAQVSNLQQQQAAAESEYQRQLKDIQDKTLLQYAKLDEQMADWQTELTTSLDEQLLALTTGNADLSSIATEIATLGDDIGGIFGASFERVMVAKQQGDAALAAAQNARLDRLIELQGVSTNALADRLDAMSRRLAAIESTNRLAAAG